MSNNLKRSSKTSEHNTSFSNLKGNETQNEESNLSGEDYDDEDNIYTDSQEASIDIDIEPNLNRNSSENTGKNAKESKKQKKKELDLAYLFADPLMMKNKKNELAPMN